MEEEKSNKRQDPNRNLLLQDKCQFDRTHIEFEDDMLEGMEIFFRLFIMIEDLL